MTTAGTLYLIPTPIGNPDDITLRAIAVLERVDLIAAEDTRHALTLLRRLGVSKPLLSYFDHNERQRAPQLLDRLRGGQSVALVSDAGMPMLNDPGYHLLQQALAAGVRIEVLPGASAIPTALVASGLPTTSFVFAGFLPRMAGAREQAARALAREPHTLVFFESPHRIRDTLACLRDVLGDRRAALAVELTKERERIHRGTISSILAGLAGLGEPPMGEMTVVVEGPAAGVEGRLGAPEVDWERPDRLIAALLARGIEPRAVRDVVAEVFDLQRRAVYQRVLRAAAETSAQTGPDGEPPE